jgi:hypothetical protein
VRELLKPEAMQSCLLHLARAAYARQRNSRGCGYILLDGDESSNVWGREPQILPGVPVQMQNPLSMHVQRLRLGNDDTQKLCVPAQFVNQQVALFARLMSDTFHQNT